MANRGDTFLLTKAGINDHLFIIISDPLTNPDQIVMANFTSWGADKDQSCVVEPGEHRFVKCRSCVYYGGSRLITLAQYEGFLNNGQLDPHDPVTGRLLDRILAGAAASPHLPLGHRQILADQGLIGGE